VFSAEYVGLLVDLSVSSFLLLKYGSQMRTAPIFNMTVFVPSYCNISNLWVTDDINLRPSLGYDPLHFVQVKLCRTCVHSQGLMHFEGILVQP
jgi:hypothetical protein